MGQFTTLPLVDGDVTLKGRMLRLLFRLEATGRAARDFVNAVSRPGAGVNWEVVETVTVAVTERRAVRMFDGKTVVQSVQRVENGTPVTQELPSVIKVWGGEDDVIPLIDHRAVLSAEYPTNHRIPRFGYRNPDAHPLPVTGDSETAVRRIKAAKREAREFFGDRDRAAERCGWQEPVIDGEGRDVRPVEVPAGYKPHRPDPAPPARENRFGPWVVTFSKGERAVGLSRDEVNTLLRDFGAEHLRTESGVEYYRGSIVQVAKHKPTR